VGALSDRLALLATTLGATLPNRVVTRDVRQYDDRSEADLKRGVLTIISLGEDGLQNNPGREARYGRHRLVIVGQILAATDTAAGQVVEDLEHAMVDDMKAFCRLPPPAGIDSLVMTAWRASGQLDAPYGSVVIDLDMMGE